MKTIVVNDKEYKVIKKYKYYTLCEDKNGFKTCFDDFDMGLKTRKDVRGVRKWESDKLADRITKTS